VVVDRRALREHHRRVKTWQGIAAATMLAGCGARTGLDAPPLNFVEPGPLPQYCQGVSDTWIYVVTEQNELLRFDPPGASFASIGTVDCPVTRAPAATPFSMAVDHRGTAYVVFDDGEMFNVSTTSASCTPTSSPLDTRGFTPTFGSAFCTSAGGTSETLFLASTTSPGQLGALDTATLTVHEIGAFSTDIGEAELTGTGDGRLFAFGAQQDPTGSHFAEVDKQDAYVLSDTIIPTPPFPMAWAFAFWGGDFYFFTSTDGATSTVGRFHPADGSFDATYASLPTGAITGAGVSTCAPR
jgi:hypothetical protein